MTNPIRPRLRQVECQPVEQDGQKQFVLSDPAGFAPNQVVVSPAVVFLLQRFDGQHTVDEIATRFREEAGEDVSIDQVASLVKSLDEAGYLDSQRFATHMAERLDAYRDAPHRPFLHGGHSFPTDPAELSAWYAALDARPLEESLEARRSTGTLVGAAAPHIDLRFGGASCRLVHERLGDARSDAETVVVLGTGHCAADDLYTLTRQSFHTPLGVVETDGELVEGMAARLGDEVAFRSELLHAQEHTVEFQAVVLRLAYGDAAPRMLPVLVGSFHDFMVEGREPWGDPSVRGFVEGLREEIDKRSRSVTYLASIDLSHLGPRYGDETGLTPEQARAVEAEDRALLGFAIDGDAEGFFHHNREAQDARRVCGFSTLYTLLRLCPNARGQLLRYEQTTFPGTTDTVAHCAMLFTEEGSS